jgi:hypothetical protein
MRTSIYPILIALPWVCFVLLPKAHAVNPPPDGGYPGFNTAEGTNALFNLNIAGGGIYNTALGGLALYSDTIGQANTAVGLNALRFNTEGDSNTAVGVNALVYNTTGIQNVAVGNGALASNNGVSSNSNVAVGYQALGRNNSGVQNVAIGSRALLNNTTVGHDGNNAVGYQALFNSNGYFNNALGWRALENVTSGDSNTAIGNLAGGLLTTGRGNVYIGASQHASAANENDTTRIGNILETFQPLVSGVVASVTVGPNGKLGNASFSSRRYKDDIKPMDEASDKIFALKPVAFRYKQEFEPTHGQQYGLIAEDVEKVDPNLVAYDEEGKVRSVRYDLIGNMLLNEFLKEHKKVEQQDRKLEQQEATIARQQKQIEALTEGLQKVSAQFEASKPAPQIALNIQ